MKDMKLSDIEFNSTVCFCRMSSDPLAKSGLDEAKAYNEAQAELLKKAMLDKITENFRHEMKILIDATVPYHETIYEGRTPTFESSLDIQVRVYERSSTDGPCKDFRYDYEKTGNISTFDKIEYWEKIREMESK